VVPKKLETNRARNAALKAERDSLQSAAPHVDDVHSDVLDHVRRTAENTGATLRSRLLTGDVNRALRVRPSEDGTVDLLPVLVHILGPDALSDVLVRHLTPTPGVLTAAERTARLAEIDDALLTLEREEEAQIEASEAAGTPVARRADADPRAVLGVE